MKSQFVIGLDYGSDSVRAILVNALTGAEISSHIHWYQRWAKLKYCNPGINQFRQHPLDHLEGLVSTISTVVRESGVSPEGVKGICVDTTGSSPLPVTKDGTPLCMTPGFENNPDAMMILWKDHTAIEEANEINERCANWGGENYVKYEGGIYSSEWFWAKILHVIKEDKSVREKAYSWLEHCDYITNVLIGNKDLFTLRRSRCAAGHKAMWHRDWDGLPSKEFLTELHPYLGELRDRLYDNTFTSDKIAGNLSAEMAEKLGLSTDTIIAVGTFDAHAGAVGAKITENSLVRVMGTSTCDIMVASYDDIGSSLIKGICGQVDGSVIPGYVGLEAGQSAFGDLLAWYRNVLLWPVENILNKTNLISNDTKRKLIAEIENKIIPSLTDAAEGIPISEHIPTALDWINGRRTPDANQKLKSTISELSLGTGAPHIFKALVNAICFGSKKIVERFETEGVKIDQVIGIGGVARKSPFIMQTLSNVFNRPIHIAESDYAPALGAAIYAAVAAGIYPSVIAASKVLGSKYEATYTPEKDKVEEMARLMENYNTLSKFGESIA
jgi:L-ribulokinase